MRFIDNFIEKYSKNINSHLYFFLRIFLISYLFPPFGCVFVSFYELYHILYDMYLGIYSFINGEILIIDKIDSQRTAFKQFGIDIGFEKL